jgi:glycosyltransferase involved in cell wall biosynthesis
MGKGMKVCFVSCIKDVQDSRVERFRKTLNSYEGIELCAIMVGSFVDLPPGLKQCVGLKKPRLASSNAGWKNFLLAFLGRMKNSVLLGYYLMLLQPDICWSYEIDAWLVAVWYQKVQGFFGKQVKVVEDLSEVYEDRARVFRPPFRHIARAFLRLTIARLSHSTVQIFNPNAEQREIYSYLARKGTVIGVYPNRDQFPAKSIPPQTGTKNPTITLVHAGALRANYGSDFLLEAIHQARESIPELKLVVLGGVAGKLRNQALLEQLIHDGNLEVRPKVAFEQVIEQLFASDIGVNLVLPVDIGHTLAQPRKIFEYFAASLPVVAADVPTIRNVVTTWECGLLVRPDDPSHIASAIVQLANDSALRQKMAKNARHAFETRLNWDEEEEKLKHVLNTLLS